VSNASIEKKEFRATDYFRTMTTLETCARVHTAENTARAQKPAKRKTSNLRTK